MASRVGRVLLSMLIVVVIVAGLLWPIAWAWVERAGAGDVSDPVSISDYNATFTVGADGMLVATEQIKAEFPSGRHGIYRFWDVSDPADPSVRYLPTIVSITRDGRPEPFLTYWESGHQFLVARIGDADTYLDPGSHTYVLTYQIPGSISQGTTSESAPWVTTAGEDAGAPGSAFLWSVVASGLEMPIARATATLRLPSPSGSVQCATDPWGTPGPCEVQGAGSPTVTVSAASLAPRTGMIVRAAMQPAAPEQVRLPWSVSWDPVLGRTPWVALVLVILALAAGLAGYQLARSTREEEPGFPVQYEPPPGLGPVQVVYLDTEGPGEAPLVASLLHLADRGLVRLERPSEDTWRITNTGTPEQWKTVDPVTWGIARDLGLLRATPFEADGSAGAGKVLKATNDAIGGALSGWSERAGLMSSSQREQGLKVLWYAAAAAALAAFVLPGLIAAAQVDALVPTLVGLVPAAFVLGGVALTSGTVGQRHTPQGQMAWARAGGFRRLLSTPSSQDRFDFSARTDAFIHYIPYAVAFGVADRWAEKYRTEMGTEPPIPVWYPVYWGHGVGRFYTGGEFDSLSKSVTASIGAYAAAQAASRGGSGGGGGSFGGGGGGGGGSW